MIVVVLGLMWVEVYGVVSFYYDFWDYFLGWYVLWLCCVEVC